MGGGGGRLRGRRQLRGGGGLGPCARAHSRRLRRLLPPAQPTLRPTRLGGSGLPPGLALPAVAPEALQLGRPASPKSLGPSGILVRVQGAGRACKVGTLSPRARAGPGGCPIQRSGCLAPAVQTDRQTRAFTSSSRRGACQDPVHGPPALGGVSAGARLSQARLGSAGPQGQREPLRCRLGRLRQPWLSPRGVRAPWPRPAPLQSACLAGSPPCLPLAQLCAPSSVPPGPALPEPRAQHPGRPLTWPRTWLPRAPCPPCALRMGRY